MGLSDADAYTFGKSLLAAKVLHRVGSSKKESFENNDKAIYRLQCFDTPTILNTYKIWNEPSTKRSSADILDSLDGLLYEIEAAAIDDNGMLDYTVAISHKEYPRFEEAICELQVVNITNTSQNERLALGLNLYKLMLRYAFLKIGIPITDAERLHFLNNVTFNVGGDLFSFQQWLDGVLRGNNKSSSSTKAPFTSKDSRGRLALSKIDHRIHFALNSGAAVGSTVSVPIGSYAADMIDKQLNMTGKVFCQDPNNFSSDSKLGLIKLPKTLGWYRSDFGLDNNELVETIAYNLTGAQTSILPSSRDKIAISFTDVNWARNAINFSRYDRDALVSQVNGIKALLRRFQSPKNPTNEVTRLSTLKESHILDTLAEERFDRITRMAQNHFAVPIVLVSLVDANRQWFKSSQWSCPVVAPATETGRDISFCGHVILQDDIMVVNDAMHDDRFAENPLVTGPLKIRFYAGCPLSLPGKDGQDTYNIGTLCLIDQRPRDFSEMTWQHYESLLKKIKKEILRRDSESSISSSVQYFL